MKPHQQGQCVTPVRAPITRVSNLITMILTPFLRGRNYPEGVDSTKNILFSVLKANEKLNIDPELGRNAFIFSMVVEALYPSLDLKDILHGIRILMMESDLVYNVDTKEVVKYVAIMYNNDEHQRKKCFQLSFTKICRIRRQI